MIIYFAELEDIRLELTIDFFYFKWVITPKDSLILLQLRVTQNRVELGQLSSVFDAFSIDTRSDSLIVIHIVAEHLVKIYSGNSLHSRN